MFKKRVLNIYLIFFTLIILVILIYYKFYKKVEKTNNLKEKNIVELAEENNLISTNIIKDVNYVTKDAEGNEYIVTALEGEIDFNNDNILFLTKVKAIVKLKSASMITIISDYGKYNTDNFDTIFSKM